ncbi:hypothetical protein LSH36_97g03005 [Paralvinella palmiformis]|uniref:60S ribosomal protein L10 n=1 Tax=Paralvinella palmiformis TaxID=53620 RepID=A0AAD9NBI2_9ANNE|nr:hypothetical protein LSH36_97g03005 [Paralvinella palmiformis]
MGRRPARCYRYCKNKPYPKSRFCRGVPGKLQTGMRGAFGKPQGTVARVRIGQALMSIRCKDQHQEKAIEALRRAKFKYPGRQKISVAMDASYFLRQALSKVIYISRKWGFTKWDREDYEKMRLEGTLIPDGVNAKYIPPHGPLEAWKKAKQA